MHVGEKLEAAFPAALNYEGKAGKLDCIFEDPEQRHILGDNMTMTGRDSHGESSDDTDLRGFGTPRDGISRILN